MSVQTGVTFDIAVVIARSLLTNDVLANRMIASRVHVVVRIGAEGGLASSLLSYHLTALFEIVEVKTLLE